MFTYRCPFYIDRDAALAIFVPVGYSSVDNPKSIEWIVEFDEGKLVSSDKENVI